jgi:hypothetical protein
MQNPANQTNVTETSWNRHLTLGCIVGLLLGIIATADVFLLRDRATRRRASASQRAGNNPPMAQEIASYLEGKSMPDRMLPSAGGTSPQPQNNLVIHREGISDLHWQGSSKAEPGTDEPAYHDYTLLYQAGQDFYVADISIRLRQIGDKRAFLGYEVRRVERADHVASGRQR